MPERGQQGYVAVIEARARAQDHLAGRRLTAPRIDELERLGGAIDAHAPVLAGGVLDHDDGVGAGRYWRAGHDLDGLARADLATEALPGADFSDDLERAGKIARTHGIPVAHRARHRRRIAVGRHIFGQYAAASFLDAHALG